MDDPTKCLYTAVLVMSIYMGEFSLDHIKKCDVDHVQSYYREMREAARTRNPKSEFDPSPLFVKECKATMFSPSKSGRYLYYIMATNADVPLKDGDGSTILFPGHVCVVEKFPNGKYYLYQSYINNYDLDGHFQRNKGSFAVSIDTLRFVMNQIEDLYTNGVWTSDTSKAWRLFTHVDGKDFEGRDFKGRSFFCYRKIPINTCTSRLMGVLKKAVEDGSLDSATREDLAKLHDKLQSV
jgi:hypothetical protein